MNGTKVKKIKFIGDGFSQFGQHTDDLCDLIKKSSKFKILPLRLAAVLTTIELVCGE